jgi:hypothetical protein
LIHQTGQPKRIQAPNDQERRANHRSTKSPPSDVSVVESACSARKDHQNHQKQTYCVILDRSDGENKPKPKAHLSRVAKIKPK